MCMAGITTHKPVSKQPAYQEVPNFGKHGIRIFKKQLLPTKQQMDIGPMVTIFMVTRMYTEQPWLS